ncbi:MAG: 50S ribosomal protein L23 [Patescibacteria group bacterium]
MTNIIKNIIKNPRITEKASFALEQNVYSFNVDYSANKSEIKKAIFTLYKVKPVKVNVVNMAHVNTAYRGRINKKQGGKKALVYLKKGDKIEFI